MARAPRDGVASNQDARPPDVSMFLIEADLIVIGGYGKARLREWVFGGVTHTFIEHAEIPVFLSH